MKEVRIFLIDDITDMLSDYNTIPAIKTLKIPKNESLWGQPLKIDGKFYTVGCSQGENYGVHELKYYKYDEDIQDLDSYNEDEIKCPVCGYEESDCWEYTQGEADEYECGYCGSILTWSREISVSYSTTVKRINEFKEID